MFGYIRPYSPELKIKEHDAFRAVYCGLCHQLGKSFGVLSRLTLNYDFVFLALLYYAQQSETPTICQGRCCVNPLQKVPLCTSTDGLVYSADIAMLMMYYKIEDNILDEKFLSKLSWKIVRFFAKPNWKKAKEREPEANEIIAQMMEKQQVVEEQKTASMDAACEPTAWALSKLAGNMSLGTAEKRATMERLGYLVGRYIYLCDAMEDLKKDLKKKNYNPLIYRYHLEQPTEDEVELALLEVKNSLYMTIGEMGRIAQTIEFAFFAPIIHNIVQYGMSSSVQEILKKEGGQ